MPNNNALKANYVYYIQKGYTKGHISRLQEYKKIQYVKKQKIKQDYGKNENVVDLVDLTKNI